MKRYLLIILTFITLLSCNKKYDEGPFISFIKPENRIAGLWEINSISVNDSIISADTLSEFHFSFFTNNEKILFLQLVDTANIINAECFVYSDENTKYLTFKLSVISGFESGYSVVSSVIPALSEENTWEITRLKRKELSLITIYNNNLVKIEFLLIYDYDNL